jgi:hypothetical protein
MLCRAVRLEQTRRTMRGIRGACLALAALVLFAPATSTLRAQEQTPPRTHIVKRGDTLWDLARLYLGDPFLWPEIYRLNTDIIDDPHWIYPGEILKLPAPGTVAAAPPPTAPPNAPPAVTPVTPPTNAPPTAEPPGPPPMPSGAFESPTIFPKQRRTRARSTMETRTPPPAPTVRLGEYLAAPFVDRDGGPRGSGVIIKAVNLSVSAAGRDPKQKLQLHDEVLIAPPAGSAAPEGEQYVAYYVGPDIEDLGPVIIPTGVVRVTRAPHTGDAAVAEVVKMFRLMQADQQLMPYDSTTLEITAKPTPVITDSYSRVKFIVGGPVLPALQDYLVLDTSSRDGIKLGDEFMLFQPRREIETHDDLSEPDMPIARAQVVRVTPYATTVMLTAEKHSKIETGTKAKRVAAMP